MGVENVHFARSEQGKGRSKRAGLSNPEKMYGIERLKKLGATVFEGSSDHVDAEMSQKSTEQLCVDDVVEIDGLKGEGPWSNKSECLFVDLMDEEVAKSNRPTIIFTKTSWNYLRSQLNASTGYNYSHDQLKNKFNKLRQIYKDFKKILSNMTGNGWDPLLGTINLKEEQRNELFKVSKRAKKFRKSACPHYEKLVRIFGDTTATGVNVCPSTRLISNSEDENENDVASNTNVGVEENDKGKSKKRVQRNRDEYDSFFSSFLDVYAENVKRKNDILEKRSFGFTSSEVDESQTSSKKDDLHEELMECLDILNTMEDVDGEAYSKILKLLHGDLA
ncbi:L10-interacting MYB domain-containing protein-like [Cucumis melo]|uniref:L10-interacting MYB domain-containing protein-like n=1 Tax=Cucumis melo TaxID=3656 RepID=A0ABM3KUR1_CUCME|nr:L10-interacting MYB domain-containing protein-like [Cucumis melo]